MAMKDWTGVGLVVAALGCAGSALAQGAERVAAHTDWSVFVADSPKECYIVSPPTGSTATRDGEATEVDRGDIRLFVTYRPGEGVSNEVSFTGGYPFQEGNPVEVAVGSETYALNPGSGDAGEWAWPASPEDDSRIIAAMKRGARATITGMSSRGTTTVDTFSLLGFTAAVGDAEGRCR